MRNTKKKYKYRILETTRDILDFSEKMWGDIAALKGMK